VDLLLSVHGIGAFISVIFVVVKLITTFLFWRYDFDLKTGKSEMTGLKACTYAVEVKDDGFVYVECPEGGTNWRLVELRPVSEGTFCATGIQGSSYTAYRVRGSSSSFECSQAYRTAACYSCVPRTSSTGGEPSINPDGLGSSHPEYSQSNSQSKYLYRHKAHRSVLTEIKVQRTREAVQRFRTGKLPSIGHKSSNAPQPPDRPAREAQFTANTVSGAKVKGRKNRAVMLHALANIEQWA
jgi:hypothetical protein